MQDEFELELQEYIYLSDAKLDGMYPQLRRHRSEADDVDLQRASAEPNRYEKLDTIIAAMEARGEVGTPAHPRRYFQGVLAMRWDILADDEGMVYFGALKHTGDSAKVVVLAGSSRYLREDLRPQPVVGGGTPWRAYSANVGHITAAATRHLTSTVEWEQGLFRLSTPQLRASFRAHIDLVRELPDPKVRLEFFAKTLYTQTVDYEFSKGDDPTPVDILLGTPYYVAMYD
jgi:hypothetical protein